MNIYQWAANNFNTETDRILITGASSGIGYQYVKQLSQLGADIYIVSEEKEKLRQIAEDLNRKNASTIIPLYCDFSLPEEVNTFIKEIKSLMFRILVNNAGIGMKGAFIHHTARDIDRIYNINTCTPLKILLATLPEMVSGNAGVIIQVTTVNVVTPIPLNALYTGEKPA